MQEKNIGHIIVGPISTNCWIYPLPGSSGEKAGCAIIDPGAEADNIIARLQQLRLVPEYILLTHGHFDHIGAVADIAAAYKTGAGGPEIAIHRLDSEYMGPGSLEEQKRSFAAAGGNAAFIDLCVKEAPVPGRLLEDGGTIGPFTVLHLPGHTKGSAAFWDREANVLFSGDTLFKGDYGRTDLPGGSEEEIIKSLRRLFGMDGGIRVFPGHGPATAIGIEAARGMV